MKILFFNNAIYEGNTRVSIFYNENKRLYFSK